MPNIQSASSLDKEDSKSLTSDNSEQPSEFRNCTLYCSAIREATLVCREWTCHHEYEIPQRRRVALSLNARLMHHSVDFVCRDTWCTYTRCFIQHFPGQPTSRSHALDLFIVQHLNGENFRFKKRRKFLKKFLFIYSSTIAVLFSYSLSLINTAKSEITISL